MAELAVAVLVHDSEHVLHGSTTHGHCLRVSRHHALELLVLHEPVLVGVGHGHHCPNQLISAGDSAMNAGVEGAEVVATNFAVAIGVEDFECGPEIGNSGVGVEKATRRAHGLLCRVWTMIRFEEREFVFVCVGFLWLLREKKVLNSRDSEILGPTLMETGSRGFRCKVI